LTHRLNTLESNHEAELVSTQAKQQQQFEALIQAMQLAHKQEMEAMHQGYASQIDQKFTSLHAQMTSLTITKEPDGFPSLARKRPNTAPSPQKRIGGIVGSFLDHVAPRFDNTTINLGSEPDSTEEHMQDSSSLLDQVGQIENV
jgi:Fe2+ transport system protein B